MRKLRLASACKARPVYSFCSHSPLELAELVYVSYFFHLSFSPVSPNLSYQYPSSVPLRAHNQFMCSLVSHLFACPGLPPPPSAPSTLLIPCLEHFILYVLHRIRLHISATFTALYLLQRLKARLYLRIHDRLQDYLRRYIFQQVVVHRWPGYVRLGD